MGTETSNDSIPQIGLSETIALFTGKGSAYSTGHLGADETFVDMTCPLVCQETVG
jgi:hypothetical protein